MIENVFTSLVRYANISCSLLLILFDELRLQSYYCMHWIFFLRLVVCKIKILSFFPLSQKSFRRKKNYSSKIKYLICFRRYLWSSRVGITLWLLRCQANTDWEYHLFEQMCCQKPPDTATKIVCVLKQQTIAQNIVKQRDLLIN